MSPLQSSRHRKLLPPNQGGDAQHVPLNASADGKFPKEGVGLCSGNLQRLMVVIMGCILSQTGNGSFFDEGRVGYIDPAISEEWEAEGDYEIMNKGGNDGQVVPGPPVGAMLTALVLQSQF